MRSFKRIRVTIFTPLEQVANEAALALENQVDMDLLGAGSTPGGALLLAHRSDVLVLHYAMPHEMLELTIAAVRAVTPARVVIIDAPQDAALLEPLYEQGVSGCLTSDRTAQELAEAVRLVANGGVWIEPPVLRSALSRMQQLSERNRLRQAG